MFDRLIAFLHVGMLAHFLLRGSAKRLNERQQHILARCESVNLRAVAGGQDEKMLQTIGRLAIGRSGLFGRYRKFTAVLGIRFFETDTRHVEFFCDRLRWGNNHKIPVIGKSEVVFCNNMPQLEIKVPEFDFCERWREWDMGDLISVAYAVDVCQGLRF